MEQAKTFQPESASALITLRIGSHVSLWHSLWVRNFVAVSLYL